MTDRCPTCGGPRHPRILQARPVDIYEPQMSMKRLLGLVMFALVMWVGIAWTVLAVMA